MNNADGLTLGDDVTVSGVLTFTSGKITTGTGTTPPTPYPKMLTTTTTCATSVSGAAQTTGWVIGNLKKSIPAGAPTCTFEVGDSNYYSQIEVVFAPETTAGNMTGAAMPHSPDGHPNISGTDINPARNVNRFWTLKDPTAVFASYSATFNFDTDDLDAGTDQLEFVIRRYDPPYPGAGTWSNVTVDEGTITSTSIKGTGITGTGDFAIGNSTVSAFLREREWVYQRELYYQ
ncbi:MAG: hypothetical protein O2845_02645 [Proteobacteria bacterium]|nr:hypothetical protein [Pseudomonadota bacterium]